MSRAVILCIVLALGAGQSVASICRAWCDRGQAAMADCHHEDMGTAASLTGDDCSAAGRAIAMLRDGDRRGPFAPDSRDAADVPRFRWAAPTPDTPAGLAPSQRARLAPRPLVLALRI